MRLTRLPSETVRRNARGFSLLELLIALVMIGVASTIAYASYQSAVIKTNRRAAQAFLMDAALRQNQFLLDRRTYAGSLADLNFPVPADVAKRYTVAVTVAAGPPPAFTLTATPAAGTPQAADGAVSLTSAGVKTPAGKW